MLATQCETTEVKKMAPQRRHTLPGRHMRGGPMQAGTLGPKPSDGLGCAGFGDL
jgi:hypothetical protein